MRAPLFALALACVSCPLTPGPRTCDDVEADFTAESSAIRTCDVAGDCGQVLTGTSCGCTRDLVARFDADTTAFYHLISEAVDEGCDLPLGSTCDCPEAHGFRCDGGLCAWNYVSNPPEPFSSCRTAFGDPFTLQAAGIAGDVLQVTVSYSGGCADHAFVPCWPDQSFMESAPVQAALELWHDDPDDPCDSIVTEDVDIDLAPLSAAWHASYGAGAGEILVRLGEWTLGYTFE